MTATIIPSLSSFSGWIESIDDHAAQRMALMGEAERLLGGNGMGSVEARHDLAGRLERWRYQLLHQRFAEATPRDRELADALDLTANALARRGPRPPRQTRAAVRDVSLEAGGIAEALAYLDPQVPLEVVAARAAETTLAHFAGAADRIGEPSGEACRRWRVLLYAPLYLSNYCINHCTYCGFRYPNAISRKHLSREQALGEAEVLLQRGFRHILLVAGDFPRLTTTEYFAEVLAALSARGVMPAVEIAPQSTDSYAALVAAGACGVTLYQETYDEDLYRRYHPRGSKVSFDWRLEGLDRAADAGISRMGLGILVGLADPRAELLAMMRHGQYLQRRFPDRTLAFSLPRIHQAPHGFRVPYAVDDEALVRMYGVLRLAFPRAELVLSTREPPALRSRLARMCMTQMSAGSCTAPGGYQEPLAEQQAGEQFPVCDHRSPAEVAAWLAAEGFCVSWSIPVAHAARVRAGLAPADGAR